MAESRVELKEPTILQVILDDNVSNGVKDELDVGCICGTSKMCVNLLLIAAFI